MAALKRICMEREVTPYFIPMGGFMVSPVLDIEQEDLRSALNILAGCVVDATAEVMAQKR